MDINEYAHKFQKIEQKYSFFDYKDTYGLKYWETVRFEIFEIIFYNSTKMIEGPSIKKNFLNKILKNLFELLNFYLKISFKKYKYICFTASRNKNNEGKNYDIISNDIFKIIKDDSLIIETFLGKKYQYTHIFNQGLHLTKIIASIKKKNKKQQINFKISQILQQEFKTKININSIIYKLIENYKLEYRYYSELFKRLKPEAIFIVQNGIQKGLFAAAKNLSIPCIEIQHGRIGYIHPAYSYPKFIDKNILYTLPMYFFSFSEYWTKNLYFPVKNIIPIGNSELSKKIIKKKSLYDITFIFSVIHTTELISLIDDLLLKKEKKICIKLHPNQFFQKTEIENHYRNYDCVKIIGNEKSIESLLAVSKSILAIQSTCVYQAIQNKVNVFLYKKMDYKTLTDIFHNPFVHLVDSAEDIFKNLNNLTLENIDNTIFFEDFNKKTFLNILAEISKKR